MKRLIAQRTLGPQLFVGERPDPARFQPVANFGDSYFMKPSGGFWTSPLDADGSSSWIRYSEQLSSGRWERPVWQLRPRRCRVAVIDSAASYNELYRRFSLRGRGDYQSVEVGYLAAIMLPEELAPLLDWEGIAEQADAIFLSHEGRRAQEISSPFYGWDVESVFWHRWCFQGEPVEISPSASGMRGRRD